MERLTATLSVSAGVALNFCGVNIWIDALHNQKVNNFSTLSPEQVEEVFKSDAFQNPDVIFFTHCHPDHFSEALARRAKEKWPNAKLILPERRFDDQILLMGEEMRIDVKGVHLTFRKLIHEEEQYAAVPHYGLLLEGDDRRFLFPADCALESRLLADFLQKMPLDAAFLDFPWVALPRGRRFIESEINAEHLVFYHLPLEEEDTFKYRPVSRRAAQWLEDQYNTHFLDDFLATITL